MAKGPQDPGKPLRIAHPCPASVGKEHRGMREGTMRAVSRLVCAPTSEIDRGEVYT